MTQSLPPRSLHTSSSSNLPSGDVQAPLNFYNPPSDPFEAPYMYVEDPPARRNYTDIARTVNIQDVRTSAKDFADVSQHAFACLPGPYTTPSRVSWDDDESIKENYYPTVIELLQKTLNAREIVIFDHTLRRASPTSSRLPVLRVHIDQTASSAAARVHRHSSSESEATTRLAGRYRIVNVWRPINGPVETSPLAFAEADSLKAEDLVPIEHRYPDRTGETAGIRHSEAQQWWYWSGMTEEERILLLCFDSARQEKRVPHTAFVDSRAEDGKPRESVEVRALVFG